MNWIHLAEVTDKWCAFLNMVMIFQVLYNAGNFLTSRGPVRKSRISVLHVVISCTV